MTETVIETVPEDPSPARPAGRGAVELRLRFEPALLAGIALIVLQTVVRAVVVLPSYYWQDDYGHLDLADRTGLTWGFLVRGYNGHLEIGANFLYWLVGRVVDVSFLPAALTLLVLQLVASCLLLRLLRLLFGGSPWVLVPFAGYLFTPLGLPVATWWAAGLEALPLQIGLLLALLGAVHAVRGGSPKRTWRWSATSVAGLAFGVLFWEKALLVVPAVVAVLLLVELAGRPVRERLRALASVWPLLLGHVVVAGLYTWLYLSVVGPGSALEADVPAVSSRVGETVFRLLLPGLFGGPWTGEGAENTVFPYVGDVPTVVFAVLFAAVVAGSFRLRGVRALQGWVLAAGYVAVDLLLVQLGRAEFLGLLARDPRYVTDALPVLAVAVCAVYSGPASRRRRPAWYGQVASSTSTALSAVAFLVASCLLTSFLLTGQLQHRFAHDYVLGVVRNLEQEPDMAVLSTGLPVSVSAATDLDGVLRAVGREHEFDQPGTDVKMFDGLAAPRSITVVDPTLEASGPVPDCGWRVEAGWQRLGTLADAGARPQVVQLSYVTGQAATLHVAVGDHEQALTVPAGVGYATFVVTGWSGTVTARVTDVAFGGICVAEVAAGSPWPR